jgi:hypothetical protein
MPFYEVRVKSFILLFSSMLSIELWFLNISV